MELLIIRHTETEREKERCIGQTDVPLSEKGKLDLISAAERIRIFQAQAIVSSDLARSKSLADKAASELGLTVELDKMWREVNFGVWENKLWDDIARQDGIAFQAWSRDFVRFAPTEGESFQSLYRRIGFQLDFLKQRSEQKIAVVSHAGAMRAALCYAIGLPLEKAFSVEINYGGSMSLLHEGGQWTLYGLYNSN